MGTSPQPSWNSRKKRIPGWVLLLALLSGCATSPSPPRGGPMPESDRFEMDRIEMVERQIRARGVRDPRLLQVLREVPRHLFVPSYLAREAYDDNPLPIGYGQTISQPYIVAYMTEQLHLEEPMKVLEIGTGSGYQAAILSRMVRKVFTVELLPPLAREASERLSRLGYSNVKCRCGDGYLGWPEEAPFDGILVTAAAPEVPQALLEQLAPGGRMILPVGSTFSIQHLILLEKDKAGNVHRSGLIGVRFVPLVPGTPGGKPPENHME